jgi:hypothetical protein
MNILKEEKINMPIDQNKMGILIIICVILSFFSIIGTCSNRASTSNQLCAISNKIDSISNENIKAQVLLNNNLNIEISKSLETNFLQFFMYQNELKTNTTTINQLQNKLKTLQNAKTTTYKNKDTSINK